MMNSDYYDKLIEAKYETKTKWTLAADTFRAIQTQIKGELATQYPDRAELHAAVQRHSDVVSARKECDRWFEEHQKACADLEKAIGRYNVQLLNDRAREVVAAEKVAAGWDRLGPN